MIKTPCEVRTFLIVTLHNEDTRYIMLHTLDIVYADARYGENLKDSSLSSVANTKNLKSKYIYQSC